MKFGVLLGLFGATALVGTPAFAACRVATVERMDGDWVLAELEGAPPARPGAVTLKVRGNAATMRLNCPNFISSEFGITDGRFSPLSATITTMGCGSRRALVDGGMWPIPRPTEAELVEDDARYAASEAEDDLVNRIVWKRPSTVRSCEGALVFQNAHGSARFERASRVEGK